jgi:hypothetical protein
MGREAEFGQTDCQCLAAVIRDAAFGVLRVIGMDVVVNHRFLVYPQITQIPQILSSPNSALDFQHEGTKARKTGWERPNESHQAGEFGSLLDSLASWRYNSVMRAVLRRATVYFDPGVHRALRLKAAETDRSVSELIDEAVRLSLREDAEDIAALKARASEPDIRFEDAVRGLKRRGKL